VLHFQNKIEIQYLQDYLQEDEVAYLAQWLDDREIVVLLPAEV
jgi:hypothetical protein